MNKLKDYNDVMNLSADITHKLQDLKFIKGNSNDYNFDVDDEIRDVICKRFDIKEC